MSRPSLEALLEQARRAQREEQWPLLLDLVRQIQALEPEAARPFIEALWNHIAESRRERQNRMEVALALRRMARDGAWEAVYREIRTLAREDEAAALHVARLLFVDASYFEAHPARISERVAMPGPTDTLTRPVRIRLYRYGYGKHALDRPWLYRWGAWVALVPVLLLLPALTEVVGWVRLLLFLVGWAMLLWMPGAVSGPGLRGWLRAVAAALLMAGTFFGGGTGLFLPALAAAGFLLGFWAGWARTWLPAGPWPRLPWGLMAGLALSWLVEFPLLQSAPAVLALLLGGLAGEGLIRWLEPRWHQDRRTRPALALLFVAYLAMLGPAVLYLLARVGRPGA